MSPAVDRPAKKTPQPLAEVAATVSIVTARDLETRLAFDPADLFRNEPGLSVRRHPNRFGYTAITVRGLTGKGPASTLCGNAGVFNLTDCHYQEWAGARGPPRATRSVVVAARSVHVAVFEFLARGAAHRGDLDFEVQRLARQRVIRVHAHEVAFDASDRD